ncbi:MAG: hypothetical protein ABS81_25445 [Pseudonocardia sp. SCN 72-86]|nr:MAG: hypothetical protein ABS81_25445 [Pseudonocardia sp. SCN 72-86]
MGTDDLGDRRADRGERREHDEIGVAARVDGGGQRLVERGADDLRHPPRHGQRVARGEHRLPLGARQHRARVAGQRRELDAGGADGAGELVVRRQPDLVARPPQPDGEREERVDVPA